MHTMDYYSAIKRNEALIHSTTWMSLKNMILQQLLTSYVFYTLYKCFEWISCWLHCIFSMTSLFSISLLSLLFPCTSSQINFDFFGRHLSFDDHLRAYLVRKMVDTFRNSGYCIIHCYPQPIKATVF